MKKYKVIKTWKYGQKIGDDVIFSAIGNHATTSFDKDGKAGIVAISFLLEQGYIEEEKKERKIVCDDTTWEKIQKELGL